MSIKSLMEYTRISKYAKFNKEKQRRETWDEQVNRVINMHIEHLTQSGTYDGVKDELQFVKEMMLKKKILGSQRALQFGGSPILRHNEKMYNCSASYADRVRVFQEFDFLSLCGCGVGISVQKHHVNNLPDIAPRLKSKKTFVIPDSIEGWADSIGVLVSSYFMGDVPFPQYQGHKVAFDASQIRPEGAPIRWGGKAPGPNGLVKALELISLVFESALSDNRTRLKPIEVYDILMYISDSTLSGGIRRCLPKGYLIKTGIDSYTQIQDCKIGDSVYLDHTTFKITNVFEQGIQKLVKIKTEDGKFHISTSNHRWLIVTKEGNIKFKKAEELDASMSFLTDGDEQIKISEVATSCGKDYTYDIEVEDIHAFSAKNPESGLESISHNSASICIFSYDDEEMMNAKTGDWQIHNPQRARSNNSVLLLRDTTTKEAFSQIMTSVKEFGEPGFIWADDTELLLNPCCLTGDTLISTTMGEMHLRSIVENPDMYTILCYDVENDKEVAAKILNATLTRKKADDIIQIVFNDGTQLKATSDHKIFACSKINTDIKNFKYIQAGKLNVGDTVKSLNTLKTIININSMEPEDVYDLEIEKYHNFYANHTLVHNCEIGLYAKDARGNSGFEFCNLTTINVKKCKTEDDFYEACKASAILGTIQASYTSFPYLGEVSENIVKREALLGCSMTGIMDNPTIALDPRVQRTGAKIIKEVNKTIAEKIGINIAARCSTIKPEGSSSALSGSSSGIHPNHAKRYIRRVQANKNENSAQFFKMHNPRAVENSVWSSNDTDWVISFLCEVPDGARLKSSTTAIDLLESVKLTQENWVNYGKNEELCVKPWLSHNVSNTITVRENEWELVTDFIYSNRGAFTGVSLLPASGDLDYPQAPFTTVLTHKEIIDTFGEGALFASGLIVDGLKAFNNNLWSACDCALGVGEKLGSLVSVTEPTLPVKNGYTDKKWLKQLTQYASDINNYYDVKETNDSILLKQDWIRRFTQFAERYCEGNLRECSHLLKHVHNWKLWLDLKREYVEVDWTQCTETEDGHLDNGAGAACSGGQCELGDLGSIIKERLNSK